MKKVSERLILVAGATGNQGHAVWRHLRAKGFPVRALTRDPDKPAARALVGPGSEVVYGDMNDLNSLRRAASGVFGVFSVQASNDVETVVRQGINLAEAARLEVVDHLVYSSLAGASLDDRVPPLQAKARIEEHIRLTGVTYTILRPVFFMENWFGQKESIDSGRLQFPFRPSSHLQMIAVDDIGALVSMAFEHRGYWLGKTMEIAGDDHSMIEIAKELGRASEHEVRYEQVGWDDFERRAGHDLTLLFQWIEDSGHSVDIEKVRGEYRNLSTFERWLNLHWEPVRVLTRHEARTS